jgi:phage regulator Rha-like protein
MSPLALVVQGKNAFVDSRDVAAMTETRHDHLLAKIDRYYSVISTDPNFRVSEYFIPSTYKDVSGRENKSYMLTKLGCDMVANKITGDKGILFTAAYSRRFREMEMALMQKQSSEWLQTRHQGKLTRRNETDVLSELVVYAKDQGSTHADMIYTNYSKMVNNAVGIKGGQREFATDKVLSVIAMIEDTIIHTVKEEMEHGVYYKEIYKHCKEKANAMMQYIYLPAERLLLTTIEKGETK